MMSELLPKFTTPVNLTVSCCRGAVLFVDVSREDAVSCLLAVELDVVFGFANDANWIGVTVYPKIWARPDNRRPKALLSRSLLASGLSAPTLSRVGFLDRSPSRTKVLSSNSVISFDRTLDAHTTHSKHRINTRVRDLILEDAYSIHGSRKPHIGSEYASGRSW